jgi:predicted MFS family arabinose efflux permease
MYAWIFRHLPGPLWVRILTSALLVSGALVLMFRYLFPWINELTNLSSNTIGLILL